jgi:hypothetical protein
MSEMRINSGGSRERRLTEELAAKEAEIARLRERLAVAEEALKPFAAYAGTLDESIIPDTARVAYAPTCIGGGVRVRDFRRARAALAEMGKK